MNTTTDSAVSIHRSNRAWIRRSFTWIVVWTTFAFVFFAAFLYVCPRDYSHKLVFGILAASMFCFFKAFIRSCRVYLCQLQDSSH